MDAFPLVGRYKLYKEGTRRLAKWLTRTAHGCRDKHVVFDDLERKAATDSSNPGDTEHKHISLTTRQMVRLAELIAEDESLEIPQTILEVTRDVIAGRECCSAWYRNQRPDQSAAASSEIDGHTFFINALRSVYDTLRLANRSHATESSKARSNDERRRKRSQNHSQQDPFYNLFQHLQVEEPADNPIGDAGFIIDTVEEPDVPDEPATEQEIDEREFAVWCHFLDLEVLREYVCTIWKEYASGKKSLLAAGAITNVAFCLMRHSCDNRLAGKMKHWAFDMCRAISEEGRLIWEDDGPDFETGLEALCWDATYILCVLTEELRSKWDAVDSLEEAKEEQRLKGAYHARLFGEKGFGALLLWLLPVIGQLSMSKYDGDLSDWKRSMPFLDDEYSAGLTNHAIKCLQERVIPAWLIAITQTCMEIHDTLNGKTGGALRALYSKIEECDTSFQTCIDHFGNQILGSQEYAAFVYTSEPYRMYGRSDVDADDMDQVHSLAMCHLAQSIPTVPASALFHVQFRALSAGILTMNSIAHVLSMAHLYKAAQQYGLVPKAWDDMEFIFTHFATSQSNTEAVHPIVTKPNANADAFAMARYFRMALGLPTAQCQRRGAVNLQKYKLSKNKCRQLMPKSALINTILNAEANLDHTMRETDMVELLLRSMAEEERKANKSRRAQANKKHTSANVLDYFEKQMSLMEPLLNFNYINFSVTCYSLLSYLDGEYRPGSKRLPEVGKSSGYDFVDLLLWNVAEAVHSEQPRTSEETKRVVQGTNFGRVAQSMNYAIDVTGSQYGKQAMTKCSGHIPKSMWPDILSSAEQGT